MTKTPEEMAEEWQKDWWGPYQADSNLQLATRVAFVHGYQAAKDQIADADKVMNSSKKLDSWISVKERLPKENKEVLVFGSILNTPKLLGVRYRVLGDQDWKYTWQGDGYIFKQDYITHWMPLPEPPTEEK